jgi:hypothetical protein
MELTTILNQCYPQPGFVYHKARFRADKKAIEVPVRPRKGSKAVCSRCEKPAPGYDTLPARRFEFIPFWGFVVFLIYARRRLRHRRREASLVRGQTSFHQGTHVVLGALGAQTVLEGSGRQLPEQLGPGA